MSNSFDDVSTLWHVLYIHLQLCVPFRKILFTVADAEICGRVQITRLRVVAIYFYMFDQSPPSGSDTLLNAAVISFCRRNPVIKVGCAPDQETRVHEYYSQP